MSKKPILNKKQIAAIMLALGILGFSFLQGTLVRILSIVLFVVAAVILLSE